MALELTGPGGATHGKGERVRWIDCARGMAAINVVIFHTFVGLEVTGIMPERFDLFWEPVGNLIRMQLMMFVAGLFVQGSLDKGPPTFLKGKLRRILYPYVLWTYLYALLWIMIPGTNKNPDWSYLLTAFFNYDGHMWFLQVLMIYYLLALLFSRSSIYVFLGFSVICALVAPNLNEFILQRVPALLIYFVFGMLFMRLLKVQAVQMSAQLGIVIVAVGFYMPVPVTELFGNVKYLPASIPVSVLGIAAGIVLSAWISRSQILGTWCAKVGEMSLEVYLAHIIFCSGIRIVLQKYLGIEDFFLHALLGIGLGVTGPMVIAHVVQKLRITYLFEFPNLRRRAVSFHWPIFWHEDKIKRSE